MSKNKYIQKAIEWVSRKPVLSMKANSEGYEAPKIFRNQRTDEEVQADISFITQGGSKYYTEIALKSEAPQKLVTKWKLLSLMASVKRGKLHLLAPKGHKMFTQRLIDQHNINAQVYSI